RKINFITIIIYISIISIMIGVAALIVVLSIFNGFRQISEAQLLGVDPNIRIIPAKSAFMTEADSKSIITKIKNIDGIKSYSPVITTKAAVFKSNSIYIVDAAAYLNYSYLQEFHENSLKLGQLDDPSNIFIGYALASRLNAHISDTVNVISADALRKSIQTMQNPNVLELKAASIFTLNVKDYDLTTAYINPETAKRLLKIKDGSYISFIDIKLYNNDESRSTAKKIKSLLNNDKYNVLTWIDINSDLYYIMQFERVAVFVILNLILLIAVFNVFASLTMTIVKKQNDIAILKSIGATDKIIQKIYLYEGLIIGVIGTFLGLVIGLLVIYLQNKFGILQIDNSKYIIDRIPMVINYWETIIVCVVSLILAALATIFPAKKAAASSIINSIKSE
ncbi:MAG: ABC transporter permease, partial [Bacteroidetes bacterium]|nr:ABC transporter permease [Bacteroidota bacterium]